METELTTSLRIALANTFMMYFKAHSYHWNVEGQDFTQYHGFFGSLYEELYDAVDPISEELRKLDVYSPISLSALCATSTCKEDTFKPSDLRSMISGLLIDNAETLHALSKTFDLATAAKEQGLANLIADRMAAHKKHEWMLKASLK